MAHIELLSEVALAEDPIEKGLIRGQVGTVVEELAPGVYEVEFIDDSGRAYASLALSGRPTHAASPRTKPSGCLSPFGGFCFSTTSRC